MKKSLLFVAFLLFACGKSDSDQIYIPPATKPTCTICFVYYTANSGGIAITKLWQTKDGSHVDNCDSNTPIPAGLTCDPTQYDCANPTYQILNTSFMCE